MNGVAPDDPDQIPLTRCPNLTLRTSTRKGRGVFATEHISAGTIIDVSPVFLLTPEENKLHIEKTSLYHYTYNWPLTTPAEPITRAQSGEATTTITIKTQAVVLGLGSLFNHSSRDQNVGWLRDVERQVIVYRALRDIAKGEELCISYGDRLTFVDADLPPQNEDGGEEGEREDEMLKTLDVVGLGDG